MINQSVTLTDKIGFHARTASIFSKAVAKFKSDIQVSFGEKKVKGKSMLAIMTLGAKHGDQVTLHAEGEDENEAIKELTRLINSNFDIEE